MRTLEKLKAAWIKASERSRRIPMRDRSAAANKVRRLAAEAKAAYLAHPEHPDNAVLPALRLVDRAALRWADQNLGGTGGGRAIEECELEQPASAQEEIEDWTRYAWKVLDRIQAAGDPLTMNSMERHFSLPSKTKKAKRRPTKGEAVRAKRKATALRNK